jgi:hypothetical protein
MSKNIDRRLGINFGEKAKAADNTNKQLLEAQNKLVSRQNELLNQQQAEITTRKTKLNKVAIQFLKARFGVAGGARSGSTTGLGASTPDAAANLFSKITGRD